MKRDLNSVEEVINIYRGRSRRAHFEYLLQRRIFLADREEKVERALQNIKILPKPMP
jgi:hypothetical protein